MLKSLLTYIETNVAALDIDTNLFMEFIPTWATADAVLMSVFTGSEDQRVTDRYEVGVAVTVRADQQATAYSWILAVHDVLRIRGAIALPLITGEERYQINSVSSASRPQRVGFDEKGRHIYSCNYVLACQRI